MRKLKFLDAPALSAPLLALAHLILNPGSGTGPTETLTATVGTVFGPRFATFAETVKGRSSMTLAGAVSATIRSFVFSGVAPDPAREGGTTPRKTVLRNCKRCHEWGKADESASHTTKPASRTALEGHRA